jgi:NADH:ubiquinone oxidoreductase subunit E
LTKGLTGDAGGTKARLVFCSGEDLAVTMPVVNGNVKSLEAIDFLVLQDSLENESLQYADVVLPAAAWSEYEGTYTNCESRVSRVRKAVDSPGEAKPGTWIITELATRLGADWKQQSSREIWENEIISEVYRYSDMDYDQLDKEGLLASDANGSGNGGAKENSASIRRFYPEWNSLNYHHRVLCAHSEGLLDVLHKDSGIGDCVPPSTPEIVEKEFIRLLEEEEQSDKKPVIDGILAEYSKRPGGLIPVLQKVQEMLGYLPVEAQNYIANGLNIPASNVFGVVSFYSFFTMIPRGKHIIRICLGTACYVKGAGKIAENLEEHFGVKMGETTEDRMFTLEGVRCVGACGLAPVVVIDEHTHGAVLAKEAVSIAESYRSQ